MNMLCVFMLLCRIFVCVQAFLDYVCLSDHAYMCTCLCVRVYVCVFICSSVYVSVFCVCIPLITHQEEKVSRGNELILGSLSYQPGWVSVFAMSHRTDTCH